MWVDVGYFIRFWDVFNFDITFVWWFNFDTVDDFDCCFIVNHFDFEWCFSELLRAHYNLNQNSYDWWKDRADMMLNSLLSSYFLILYLPLNITQAPWIQFHPQGSGGGIGWICVSAPIGCCWGRPDWLAQSILCHSAGGIRHHFEVVLYIS